MISKAVNLIAVTTQKCRTTTTYGVIHDKISLFFLRRARGYQKGCVENRDSHTSMDKSNAVFNHDIEKNMCMCFIYIIHKSITEGFQIAITQRDYPKSHHHGLDEQRCGVVPQTETTGKYIYFRA